jgi:hypothetical protein
MIKAVWGLCAAHEATEANPKAALLISQFRKAKREAPLTFDELVDLHQIMGFTQLMANKQVWPASLLSSVPKQAVTAARECYQASDVCLFPDIREEVVTELKKRGLPALVDYWLNNQWRVDISLKHVGVIFTSKSRTNEFGGVRGRDYIREIGLRHTLSRVLYIDADKWPTLTNEEKQMEIQRLENEVLSHTLRG